MPRRLPNSPADGELTSSCDRFLAVTLGGHGGSIFTDSVVVNAIDPASRGR
jgi:hypothetical protein